jgi:uncharacterized protein with von Willebrand factor type A (vWA) domain
MTATARATVPPTEILLGFTRALRAAGVAVTADRERTYLAAVAEVGLDDQAASFHAGRATLCGSPADLERHDLVYAAWFGLLQGTPGAGAPPSPPTLSADLTGEGDTGGEAQQDPLSARASRAEVLRHRDVASLTPREKATLAAMFGRLRPPVPRRRTHRLLPARRGAVDPRRTLRAVLANLGEPGLIAHRARGTRPRRVVLLIDVSGSMQAYADSLLRLAHTWCRGAGQVEVFTVGTRLTNVTRPLHLRDPDRALAAAGDVIADWSGGTRLAEGIKAFLDRFGRRGMARGAVVVIVSDGWERGDTALLGEQMRRLRALAHRVVWANPHRGHTAYQPIQGGIVAALPHIDDFVAGHSLAAFAELTEVVAGA